MVEIVSKKPAEIDPHRDTNQCSETIQEQEYHGAYTHYSSGKVNRRAKTGQKSSSETNKLRVGEDSFASEDNSFLGEDGSKNGEPKGAIAKATAEIKQETVPGKDSDKPHDHCASKTNTFECGQHTRSDKRDVLRYWDT